MRVRVVRVCRARSRLLSATSADRAGRSSRWIGQNGAVFGVCASEQSVDTIRVVHHLDE